MRTMVEEVTGSCDFWRHLSQPWWPHGRVMHASMLAWLHEGLIIKVKGEGQAPQGPRGQKAVNIVNQMMVLLMCDLVLCVVKNSIRTRLNLSEFYNKIVFWNEYCLLAELKQSMMTLWPPGLTKVPTMALCFNWQNRLCIANKDVLGLGLVMLESWGHIVLYYGITWGWLWVLTI